MRQDAAERVEADVTLADMLVTIDARTEMRLRIVDMNDHHAIKAHGCVKRFDRLRQTCLGRDVVARCEGVRRVNANSHGHILNRIENGTQVLEARAERRAHAGSVLNQDAQAAALQTVEVAVPKANAARSLMNCLPHGARGLRGVAATRRSRMNHQIIRAEVGGTHHLVVKCLNRPHAHHRLGRCQIDQIIGVNDQRAQTQLGATSAEP